MGIFPASLPSRREGGRLQVLSWTRPASRLRGALEELGRDVDGDDLLVIHVDDRPGPAARLFALAGYRGADVVVWGAPDAVLGQPDPGFLYPYALAVRGAAVPSVSRAVEECESIWDLVRWAVSHEWIDRLRLLVLPAPPGTECWEVGDVDHVSSLWSLRGGLLPAPRWLPTTCREPAPASPAPVRMPRRRFIPPPAATAQIALETWARRSRWLNRARLVLPWRWGLLERAMRSQW